MRIKHTITPTEALFYHEWIDYIKEKRKAVRNKLLNYKRIDALNFEAQGYYELLK